jgi:hypothetical protein
MAAVYLLFLVLDLYMKKYNYEGSENIHIQIKKANEYGVQSIRIFERVCYLAPTPTITCLIEREERF